VKRGIEGVAKEERRKWRKDDEKVCERGVRREKGSR